jgi:hypothetical protein
LWIQKETKKFDFVALDTRPNLSATDHMTLFVLDDWFRKGWMERVMISHSKCRQTNCLSLGTPLGERVCAIRCSRVNV